MQTAANQGRISWIDMAKGYGTLLVILAHIGSGIGRLWIYTFHMPLFFFLSGYVFSTKYSFGEFFKKKCKTIVVPYFCLGMQMVLYETFVSHQGSGQKLEVFLRLLWDLLWQRRLWTLWFIACLFFLNIIFYALVKKCRKEWIVGVISGILPILGLLYYRVGGGYLPWNIDVCLMAIPFFFVGFWMKNHSEKIAKVLDRRWKKIVLFVGMLLVNLICGALSIDESWNGLEMFYSKYGSNPFFTYVAAFAGVICVVLVAQSWSSKLICYIGENTMLYYAWHQTIMMPVVEKFLKIYGITQLVEIGSVWYNIIWLLGIVGITTIFIWLFKRLGWKFMLGK